jgi:tyrosyl-tRNA synthetase
VSWDVLPISNLDERSRIVTKDTEEIILVKELKRILKNKTKPISYWGNAPTGPPHIGYYRSIAKQIDLSRRIEIKREGN